MFLGAILCLGEPFPQIMFGNKGETNFLGKHHIKEVIIPLLVDICGDHMVF